MKQQKVVRKDAFEDYFLKAGISNADKETDRKKAFTRQVKALKNKSYIGEWDGYVWPLDRPDK